MRAAGSQKILVMPLCLLLCCGLLACSGGKSAEDYVKEGKTLLNAKQFDQAIASFNEALKLNPKSIQALNNRGIAYCNKGDQVLAIKDFSRLIELDPKYGKAYNNRAVAYLLKGDLDKARQDVAQAQALGIPVNQMLIDALAKSPPQAAGPGTIPGQIAIPGKIETMPGKVPVPSKIQPTPGQGPAPAQPAAPSKPEAKGKGEGQSKESQKK